ncbi:MAG: flavodoxin domain-containing protein [Chloroflexi bacterium]|nr:flavodoxin domain-containing protein [Chloroflexota bacterium]
MPDLTLEMGVSGTLQSVTLKPVIENPSLDGSSSVVVGSAVNGAIWVPEVGEFVETNQGKLNQVGVVLFCVHIMNLGNDEKSKQNRLAYLNEVQPLLKPADEAWFAGIGMNPQESSWLEQWVSRTFKIAP